MAAYTHRLVCLDKYGKKVHETIYETEDRFHPDVVGLYASSDEFDLFKHSHDMLVGEGRARTHFYKPATYTCIVVAPAFNKVSEASEANEAGKADEAGEAGEDGEQE